MRTKFQRVLSIILCAILVMGTMSTMTFAADESDFDFKTYQNYAAKENIHYLMDIIDDALASSGIREEINLVDPIPIILPGGIKIVIDVTSIDAALNTLDNFRTPLNLVLTIGSIGNVLGDLSSLNLNVLDSNLTRSGNGDVKIFSEIIEFAAANTTIIGKFIDGSLDFGKLGELLEIDLSDLMEEGGISAILKEAIVSLVYDEGTAEYNTAVTKAKGDFDAFVYEDMLSLLTGEGEILEGIELTETTTINNIITQAFNLLIDKYVVANVDGLTYDFSDLGEEYAGLNEIIVLNGDYSLNGIKLENSVLDEINDVLGLVFKQIVPSYNAWEEGNYTKIGDNMRGIVRYIAEESGFIENVDNLSDEALMVEILKVVFAAADQNGEKEIYNRIADATTMLEIANGIAFQLVDGKYTYTEGQTYEHVLGDVVIDYVEDVIPLYDEKGNEVTVGSGKTVWEALNYILNFYLADKGLDTLVGFETDKGADFFDKLDLLLDYTADDGDADFDSEKYFTALIESVFTIDLQTFVNLTAAKALNFAGEESIGTFLYNTVYNILNSWTGTDKSVSLTNFATDPFQNTLSNQNLSTLLKAVIETLNSRADSLCTFIGIILGVLDPIMENVEEGRAPADCMSTGTANKKTCLDCGKVFSTHYTIPAKGHQESVEVITAATCTTAGENEYTCVVCDNVRRGPVSAHGHSLDAGKQTVAPTCDKDGTWTYYCTVCGVGAKTKTLPALGHKKDGGSVTKAPTCTEAGTKTYKCTVCAKVLGTETIPAKGHTPDSKAVITKAPTCSQTGLRSYKCVECKVSVQDEVMPKTAHTSDGGKVTKKATYQAKGEKVYSCTVCKTVIKTEEIKKLALSKVTGIALKSAKAKAVTFTWNAVKDATGYTVQYTTNNGLTWNSLDVTSATVTIKKLKAGAKVKIKVTATIGKKVKSKVSDIFEGATKPAKVTVKTLKSAAAKKAVVTWTALKNVSGYEVMYSTSKKFKKDKKTVTVNKAKAKKTTLKKLKSGKKYFVKVRAFTKVGGKKIYGAYSKVMNVKVK